MSTEAHAICQLCGIRHEDDDPGCKGPRVLLRGGVRVLRNVTLVSWGAV